ncbi:AAA family ATPase [Acidaminobacter sp. JC074]|uniref:sigma-54 interaction domain-containing protein n=1 Tax=Acidaminobacter sp. JC074 TaxID=2530199 RepID=UPI001F115408|nr:sigma 54-interacting transcriptional regulator [Acidaminobacter sp. JC074]MCH4889029.1 AAA family ATPase [Acidaminobacter sp. JC074]
MSQLKKIKETAKQVANALSEALQFDIEIVDENLEIIVLSDHAPKPKQDFYYDSGIVSRILFKENGPKMVMISDPGNDPRCEGCIRYSNCSYKTAIYSVIKNDDKIIGAMGIATRKEDLKDRLISEADKMQNFIQIMSELLASKAKEYDIYSKLQADAQLLDMVINNIDKGVVTLDANLNILRINNKLIKQLNLPIEKYLHRHISLLFDSLGKERQEILETKSLEIEIDDSKYFFMISFNPLYTNKGLNGFAMIMDDLEEVHQMSYKLLQKQDEILLKSIIGESSAIRMLKEKIKAIVNLDSTVLLYGETGTGKELFARALHFESERRNGPFVSINCGAIPESLIESELFGYDKGTFTGADKIGKHGKFFLANKGTILLDEVENMPLHLQQKMLRVIERKQIERIGSVESIPIDVRIIAATNERLDVLVERNQFREDLFHRLNVFSLMIPNLKNRENDLFILTDYFIKLFNKKFGKYILDISDEVRRVFYQYEWKGNIRELQNTIEYAVHMEKDDYITLKSLPYQFHEKEVESRFKTLEALEWDHIKATLDYFGWHEEGRLKAAQELGISRSTIYRKISKMNKET